MKILILTGGGKNIGFGHVTRCIALYQGFKEKNINTEIIVNGDSTVNYLLKGVKHKNFNWLKNKKDIFKQLKGTDIAIIDSYFAPFDFYKRVSEIVKIPVCIDDYKRLNYPKGIVINGSIYAREIDYPKSDIITYLLGTKYTPLRREFWRVPQKRINKNINSIMITFGGNDTSGLTLKITNLIKREYPRFIKNIIIGRGFKNIKEIERLNDEKTRLIYYPDANTMRKVMLESDITISAGGQTLYELARIGVPTIALAVSQNQLNNIHGWQKAGFIEYAGWWHQRNLPSKILKCMQKLKPQQVRLRMNVAGRNIIDGDGARRVTDILLYRTPQLRVNNTREDLDSLKLRKATKFDCRDLWIWRNHPEVRKWTLNTQKINFSHHCRWFAQKLQDKNTQIYIAEIATLGKIGQVRFDMHGNNCALINVNLNPLFFGRNLGNKIIRKGTSFLLAARPEISCIVAEVLNNNSASQRAFRKAGYVFSREAVKEGTRIKVFTFKRKSR